MIPKTPQKRKSEQPSGKTDIPNYSCTAAITLRPRRQFEQFVPPALGGEGQVGGAAAEE